MPRIQRNAPTASLLDRLRAIDWAANAGTGQGVEELFVPSGFDRVEDRELARKEAASVHWDNVRNEASNQQTGYLFENYREQYRFRRTAIGRLYALMRTQEDSRRMEIFEGDGIDFEGTHPELAPAFEKIGQALGFTAQEAESVFFRDFALIAGEECYREFDLPNEFGSELLGVYEAGHIPVGWNGTVMDWPEGTLLIY